MAPKAQSHGRQKHTKPDTGGTTDAPPSEDMEECHHEGDVGATVVSSSSSSRMAPCKSSQTADPTSSPRLEPGSADDLYYQVALDVWIQPGPSHRLGKQLDVHAQPMPGAFAPLAQPEQRASEPYAVDAPMTQQSIANLVKAVTLIS